MRLSGEGLGHRPDAHGGSSVPKGAPRCSTWGRRSRDDGGDADLSGMTYDEAKAALEKVGLYLEATGTGESGKVFSQSVNAGTVLDVGTAVEVKFTDDTARTTG
ncbi:MAG: PASTA domain-containing protein [Evtepia gabavorous]